MDLARLTPNLLSLRAPRSMQPLVSVNRITCWFWSDCNPALYPSSLNSAILSALLSYSRSELKIKGQSHVSFESVHMNTFNGSLIFCGKINAVIDSAPQGPPCRAHPAGLSQPQNQARPCTHTHKRHTDAHARSPIWSVVSRAKGKRVVTRVSEMLN